MKFKSDIEIQAGVEAGGSTGSNGQVLIIYRFWCRLDRSECCVS